MMLRIVQTRSADRATLWLLNSLYLWVVPLVSLQGLWIVKDVPWWSLALIILLGSVWVTRIRIVRGEHEPSTRIAVLWLGVIPVWRRSYGRTVIAAERSDDNDGHEPDEVTINFLGGDPWSFSSSRAEELARWLNVAQTDLAGVDPGRQERRP